MARYGIPEGETVKRLGRGAGLKRSHKAKPKKRGGRGERGGFPPKPNAGRSALSPGHLKKAAGVQSARSFAPGHVKRGTAAGPLATAPATTVPRRGKGASMTGPSMPAIPAAPRGAGPSTRTAPKPPSGGRVRGSAAPIAQALTPVTPKRGERGGFPKKPKGRARPPVSRI